MTLVVECDIKSIPIQSHYKDVNHWYSGLERNSTMRFSLNILSSDSESVVHFVLFHFFRHVNSGQPLTNTLSNKWQAQCPYGRTHRLHWPHLIHQVLKYNHLGTFFLDCLKEGEVCLCMFIFCDFDYSYTSLKLVYLLNRFYQGWFFLIFYPFCYVFFFICITE